MIVNNGEEQRSRVYRVAVPAADYPHGALVVSVTGVPRRVIPNAYTEGELLILEFHDDPTCEAGSVPDGRWAVVPAKGHFHRLFGDGTGDGKTDEQDLDQFAGAFGSSEGDPEYRDEFDSNQDGAIDSTDWLDFANRYGVTL